jgi:hypothetical protein
MQRAVGLAACSTRLQGSHMTEVREREVHASCICRVMLYLSIASRIIVVLASMAVQHARPRIG